MTALAGRHILVVEDETLIAMELEDVLHDAGATVSVAGSLSDALRKIAARRFDVAVLDVALHGEQVYPAADSLAAQAVPFVFMTGHSAQAMPEAHRNRPLVGKPCNPAMLVAMIARVASGYERAPAH
jgi:DNA-binding NtrC family response regulator